VLNQIKPVIKGVVWSSAAASALAAIMLVVAYFHVMSLA
jgi:hypothetical protein